MLGPSVVRIGALLATFDGQQVEFQHVCRPNRVIAIDSCHVTRLAEFLLDSASQAQDAAQLDARPEA